MNGAEQTPSAAEPAATLAATEATTATTDPTEARDPIRCPWCDAAQVERVAVIGSHLMVSQYICLECRCPFEVIRR